MVVVFVSVSAALTLLPAFLGILGHRVNLLSIRRRRGALGAGLWSRSADVVMRHPVLVILLVAAILGTLLYPVSHIKVGIPEASVLPEKYESRAGDDILKENFEYAALNPMEVVATVSEDPLSEEGFADTRELGEVIREAEGISRVESIYTVGAAAAGEYATRVADARKEAQREAAGRVDDLVRQQIEEQTREKTEEIVERQLSQIETASGGVPPGTEEQVRAEVEPRVAEEVRNAESRIRAEVERRGAAEVDRRVPELPEGLSANGRVTPEGVANFLKLPAARESEELQSAIDSYVAGERTLIRAVTEVNPYTQDAYGAVDAVRAVETPEGTSFLVGGLSAGQKDFIGSLYGKAPLAAAFVIGATYLILLITFRSIFIPLKAVIVNILSLTASFGAVVFVFQDGNLSGLLNFTPLGFVDATLPILMFCIIFGVSMDYEVFLLSRMKEAYENGDSNTASVSKGLVATAGIITSAAAIIIVVTGAFAFTGIILTKAVGLGLAVAVFVDATIIRILLVPATMRILGDWNWWPGGRKSTFTPSRQWPSRRSGIGAEEERLDEQSSQDEIEQAEQTYRSHVETRRRLGTTLAEFIHEDRDREELGLLLQNLNQLINEADLKRTELYYERLTQRLKVVEAEHKLAWKAAHEAAGSLEAARKAYAQAAGQEQRLSSAVRRLEELRRREMERLEQLRKKEQEKGQAWRD